MKHSVDFVYGVRSQLLFLFEDSQLEPFIKTWTTEMKDNALKIPRYPTGWVQIPTVEQYIIWNADREII